MKSFPCLSDGGQQRLRSILEHLAPGPWPHPEQAAALREILVRAGKAQTGTDLGNHVGFLDEVSLVSNADERDTYDFSIVMPADANTSEDRLSVLQPLSLAVLGRRIGESVSWECPRGVREMRIAKVRKFSELAV